MCLQRHQPLAAAASTAALYPAGWLTIPSCGLGLSAPIIASTSDAPLLPACALQPSILNIAMWAQHLSIRLQHHWQFFAWQPFTMHTESSLQAIRVKLYEYDASGPHSSLIASFPAGARALSDGVNFLAWFAGQAGQEAGGEILCRQSLLLQLRHRGQ